MSLTSYSIHSKFKNEFPESGWEGENVLSASLFCLSVKKTTVWAYERIFTNEALILCCGSVKINELHHNER